MTTILFMLSFSLLAIAFFLIILLFLKLANLKEIEKKQEALLKEFESVITSYVMEIKEENEVFLERIKDLEKHRTLVNKNLQKKSKTKSNESPELKTKTSIVFQEPELTKEDISSLLPSLTEESRFKPDSQNTELSLQQKEDIKDEPRLDDELYIQSLVAQIQLLKKQGLTLEEIAKKLNKGKTEIELLLKFR
ncbi:hypothetical protein ACLM5H_07000 [Fredinandcohnia humi]